MSEIPSKPITRKEQYLAKAAGQAVEIPSEPITREEAYLDAIAKGSGGGGGTSDYSQLTNKPQINGTTLTGNKSASDLSLASTSDLAGKVDKVEGKVLSTNDYTDEDKAIVGGVTEALAGKQDTLTFDDTPTDNSNNPVKSNGVYDALALKQDKTDNTLQTTNKTVVGAVNELKSGLTNVDVALSVPDGTGKNLIPMTVANIKEWNTEGVWADNVYTINDVAFTINTDSNGNVISVIANGTASATSTRLKVCPRTNYDNMAGCILSGCPSNDGDYRIRVSKVASPYTSYADNTGGDTVISNSIVGNYSEIYIQVNNGKTAENVTFYPMIRPTTITDSTFAPYIPSVESRIEAVESGKQDKTDNNLQTTSKTVVGAVNEIKSGLTNANSNIATLETNQSSDIVEVTTDLSDGTNYYFTLDNKVAPARFNRKMFIILAGNQDGSMDMAMVMYTTDGSSTMSIKTDKAYITLDTFHNEDVIKVSFAANGWVKPQMLIQRDFRDALGVH